MSTMTLHPVVPTRVARSGPARAADGGGLRLTRRGRLAVLLAWLVLALVVGFSLAAGSAADLDSGAPQPARVVVVGTGDTLWGLAADAAAASGEDDVRGMVRTIQELNGLESGLIQTGQQLRVPLG